jgi:hypothetical protein
LQLRRLYKSLGGDFAKRRTQLNKINSFKNHLLMISFIRFGGGNLYAGIQPIHLPYDLPNSPQKNS